MMIVGNMNEIFDGNNIKPIILVVLGPHRSGTSALTGMLSILGANLPENLMKANSGNSVGYFESTHVMSFNDRLLSQMGSSWHDISSVDQLLNYTPPSQDFIDEAVELLKTEFINATVPIIKDPRMCRLVSFWSEVFNRLGRQPIYIHTHRNPLEMAQSLAARHPISINKGLLIWLRHVLDAEATTRNDRRAFTSYQALLNNWRVQVSQIEKATGFYFDSQADAIQKKIDDFLSVDLRHQISNGDKTYQSQDFPYLLRETLNILEGWRGGISRVEDYPKLDKIRERLDNSTKNIL